MAALRNAVISLLRTAGVKNIAQAMRKFTTQTYKALVLVGVPRE
jgi:hypothetical protein